MKKLIISAVVAAGAIFGAYTANQSNNEVAMSDLQIENVEALADREDFPGYRVVKIKERRNGQVKVNCYDPGRLICEGSSY